MKIAFENEYWWTTTTLHTIIYVQTYQIFIIFIKHYEAYGKADTNHKDKIMKIKLKRR